MVETRRRRVLGGEAGQYEIDIVVDLEVFGGALLRILVECKRHKNPVKRDVVMVLHAKLQELGAHKGMIFSTSGFQAGAIRYATAHGIAAVRVAGDETAILAKATTLQLNRRALRQGFVGWMTTYIHDSLTEELLDHQYTESLQRWLAA